MWTVIYVTTFEKTAKKIYDQLTREGFLIKVRHSKRFQQYEILVPKSELKEVEEVLTTILP